MMSTEATPAVSAEIETPATTETAPAVETPAKTTESPVPEAETPAADDPVKAAVAAAAYAPSLKKVKVMDQEFDVDPEILGLIKDEKVEKKLKALYEKALGLDYAKPKHEALQAQHQQFQEGFKKLGSYLEEGRLDDFLSFWKIPKKTLYEYVAQQLRYEELPPEQKAAEDRRRQLETDARQAKESNASLLQAHQQTLVTHRVRELDTALSRSDIAEVALEYDTLRGTPGSFRQKVVSAGRMAAMLHQKDLSVEDAVKEVMADLGYTEQEVSEQEPNPARMVAPVAQKKLPVLPNLGSGGASPVAKTVKSIAEMRALSKTMRNA